MSGRLRDTTPPRRRAFAMAANPLARPCAQKFLSAPQAISVFRLAQPAHLRHLVQRVSIQNVTPPKPNRALSRRARLLGLSRPLVVARAHANRRTPGGFAAARGRNLRIEIKRI